MKNIDFLFEDTDQFELPHKKLIYGIKKLIREEFGTTGDICIIFCSDNYLLDINKKYLNHDYYTDIITFNYVEDKVISGDLFISTDRIRENSINFENNFEEELFRVVFHGLLHLFGYDDKSEDDKILMTAKENYYLELNGFKEDKR